MDDLRLQAVAARVVAWHNRHPLARRISVQQVKSVGYVALAVGGPPAAAGPLLAAAPAEPAGADPVKPAAAAASGDDDFAAAFAALAEHQAADAHANVTPSAAAEPEAQAGAVEVEFDVDVEAGPDAAAAAAAADADADAPADAPTGAPAAAASAEAELADSEVATLVAPDEAPAAPAASVVPHVPTLRDRVLVRAQQPAAQGALLATHDGYRPMLHPHTHAPTHAPTPAWAGGAADPAEGDRFMAPLSPRDLALWVVAHGRALLQPPTDGPIRRVSTALRAGGPAAGTTYVLTAAIAGGGLSSRVLVGAGSPGAVLGTRLWSLPRVASAAALAAALLAAAAVSAAGWLRPAAPHAESAPAAHGAAASAADAGASAPAADSHEHGPAVTAGAHAAVKGRAPASPELAISTVKPMPAYAQKGAVGLPPRGLGLSEAAKAAARDAVAAARVTAAGASTRAAAGEAAPAAAEALPAGAATAAAPSAAPSAATPAAPSAAMSAAKPAAKPAAVVPAGPSFAISTRILRTRAEAEQLQAAIGALLRTPGAASHRVDLLPEGDDWRVVAWPFIGKPEADRVRGMLAGRGMKVDVVQF